MKTKIYFAVILFICCYGTPGFSWGILNPATNFNSIKAESPASTSKKYTSVNSSAFTENKGQVLGYDNMPHPEVKFVFQQGNTQLFLLETGIAYQFTRMHFPDNYSELMAKRGGQNNEIISKLQDQVRAETFRMDMKLVGANAHAEISGEGKSKDHINFYNLNILDVHGFSKVTYHEIYPGIDWVIYNKNGKVKYDFVVNPGADPSLIKMQFEYQEELSLTTEGGFTLKNRLGSIAEQQPISYQDKSIISTKFKLDGNAISFALASYDQSRDLVVDPAVVWATYYGDINPDIGYSCSTDASGNVYLAGTTSSQGAIASGGYQNNIAGGADAFLVKFDNNGTRLWATYYGGTSSDYGYGCCTDASGNSYLTGRTISSTGIASLGHQNTFGGGNSASDAFLVKFDNNGTRLWATYYGGTGNDYGFACCTDASGNVYMTGNAGSSTNIAFGGYQNAISAQWDAFLVKFNSNGVRQWATYYGDTGVDEGRSCATDASGNVYLAGDTDSPSGIASGGHDNTLSSYYDAFLVKFDANGSRQWATYYGGTGIDFGLSCATDNSANIYLTGSTESTGSMASGGHSNTFGGGFTDAFLVKFNSSGARLWGTYYGGSGSEIGHTCFTDASGDVYMGGETGSSSAIATPGYQTQFGAPLADGFLVKFDNAGVRQWGTYFGGPDLDVAYSGAVDNAGNSYLAGYTNSSSNIAYGGHQNIWGTNSDAFLTKFCGGISPSQPLAISGNTLLCAGIPQTYSVSNDPDALSYNWLTPSGWLGTSNSNTIYLIPDATGLISVAASGSCGVTALQSIYVTVNPQPVVVASSGTICAGQNFIITPLGASTYTISGGSMLVSPLVTTAYSVTGTSVFGCVSNVAIANVTVDQCTSIQQTELEKNSVEVVPNPNNGSFELRSANTISIIIYNETGQCVWKKDLISTDNLIVVQGMGSGVYFAHLVSESGKQVKKIVVIGN